MMAVDLLFKNLKEEGETIFSYKGEISEDIIKKILFELEDISAKYGKRVKRKLFFISVELLQNVYHHALSKENVKLENVHCLFIVSLVNDKLFKISSGNFVGKDKYLKIVSRIEQLNLMSDEELRKLYKRVLNNKEFSEKGGGGLGMIDIRRKTEMPINYNKVSFNKNLYFFNFSVFLTNKK